LAIGSVLLAKGDQFAAGLIDVGHVHKLAVSVQSLF
jgi:hypothetical protein